MKIDFHFRRCCRRAGGLSLGAAWHFPTTISSPEKFGPEDYGTEIHSCATLIVGLLFWQLTFYFRYGFYRCYHFDCACPRCRSPRESLSACP